MFKLHHRHKSDRAAGERLDFRFSRFQAFKVPQGWDKLFVSIISVDTGKTVAKSCKTAVHGGTCQWTETLSETICFSQDSSRELEESLFKIVISMGSARAGILGEAIVNLMDYISSKDSGTLSLPLKQCNYGTIIQVRVQCLPPSTRSRIRKAWIKTSSHIEDNTDNDDVDRRSDLSDNRSKKSNESFSGNHLATITYSDETGNKGTSFSTSGSHHSSDSGECYFGKPNFSPGNNLNCGSVIGKQDSTCSHHSVTYVAGPVDDVSRSGQSSFNSRNSGSFVANQWQDNPSQTSVHGNSPLPFRDSGASKDLLEEAEETIDELRDEAKMWERHARKLKVDLDVLKKECSDTSRRHADLDIELSAAYAERDSLKHELQQLNNLIHELKNKDAETDTIKIEDIKREQKELEDEVKFQKEANSNLALQLKKTQESNLELVSILQELEEMVEKQREKISELSQKGQVVEHEEGMDQKLMLSSKQKNTVKLEKNAINTQDTNETAYGGCDSNLVKEIANLEAKVQELERDCAELTDENLELIFKIKELKKDAEETKSSCSSTDSEFHSPVSPASPVSAVNHIKTLEKKCVDLELELQYYKDESCNHDDVFCRSIEMGEKMQNPFHLQEKLESFVGDEGSFDTELGRTRKDDLWSSSEISKSLCIINRQLYVAFSVLEDLFSDSSFARNKCSTTVDDMNYTDEASLEALTETMANNFLELNEILNKKVAECKSLLQCNKNELKISSTVNEEDWENMSEVEEIRSICSAKDKEILASRKSKKKLENLISISRREKSQLEENLRTAQRENDMQSKCLEDVRHELMMLSNSMESHVSANKILERKSMELESCKHELDLHISELEQENIQLSERISGLEAQLRYLTNEKESGRVELENSRSIVVELKNEISNQQIEVESQKLETKQKIQESQKQLSEVQEESDVLRRSHSKLQATVERLIDESASLQKLNGDLKKQKSHLHERITYLEVELNESQRQNSDFLKKADVLEAKLSSMQKDILSKESSLMSQLESLFQEHKLQEENISQAHNLLYKMDLEKTTKLESLQKELANLTMSMSSSNDEEDKLTSDGVIEASSLCSVNAKLEDSLRDACTKIEVYEAELQNIRQESGYKVKGLVDLLNASKQSEEMLLKDIDHMQRVMDDVKSSDERYKKLVNELELKLKASDYEKEQMTEDISGLKFKLEKIVQLQKDFSALKRSHDDAKFEKEKLENKLKLVSEECEELKSEKITNMEKILNLQNTLHDSEDDRRSMIALEEKVLRLEGDLTAREAVYAQEAELKNELKRNKRISSEYLRKIQSLEDENDEMIRKVTVLEEQLILSRGSNQVTNEEKQLLPNPAESIESVTEINLHSKVHLLESDLAEALEENTIYKAQLKRALSEAQITKKSKSSSEGRNDDGRISQLEAELKDMQERYLQMSLQYAEVEAQREEMVMKLKSMAKNKGWFS